MDVELLGDRLECEHASGVEAVGVAWEVAVSADTEHDPGVERLAGAGTAAGGVELFGAFGVGVIIEQSVWNALGSTEIGFVGLSVVVLVSVPLPATGRRRRPRRVVLPGSVHGEQRLR
jgi:hypothetical protein